MTRKAKMTDSKPVVTMGSVGRRGGDDLLIDGDAGVILLYDGQAKPFIMTYAQVGLGADDLHAIADFLDQLEDADLLSQVTE